MRVVAPLADAWTLTRTRPRLVALVLAVSIASLVCSIIPLAGWVTTAIIAGFSAGGFYGVFNRALAGRSPGLDEFVTDAHTFFAPLVGAYLLLGFIMAVSMAVTLFASAVVFGLPAVHEWYLLVLFIGAIIPMRFLQFIDVAIVVGDHTAIDAFVESLRIVRENPVSALSYMTVRTALLGIGLVAFGLVSITTGQAFALPYEPAIEGSVLWLLIGFAVHVAFTMVAQVYHVAYYRQVT